MLMLESFNIKMIVPSVNESKETSGEKEECITVECVNSFFEQVIHIIELIHLIVKILLFRGWENHYV